MSYRIISADCHIDMTWMPGDLWVKNVPAKLRDRVPQVRETGDGPRWFAEEKELGVYGGLGFGFDRVQRGFSKHVERMFDVGFYEGGPHPTTPDLRLKDQDLDGIDAEVMYGILGIGMRMQDRELIQAVYEVYNSWAADFCKTNPRRFVGLACIPNHDPEIAAKEVRRAAALGLKGADFAVSTAAFPIWHGAWDPLWEAAQECRFPISFHSTGFKGLRTPDTPQMEQEYMLEWRLVRSALFQLDGMEVLVSLLSSGACEKYPDFKFVLGEAGVTWIPYVLDRLDTEYNDRARALGFSMKPSDYFRRQGYTTYQQDQFMEPIIPLVGEDNILWGADYPHPDCIWPDSKKHIEKNLGMLPEHVRKKITCDNVAKLYRI